MQKFLSWINAEDKSFTFSSQVGCYDLAVKEYIYSNFKTKKSHSCGF